MGKDQRRHYEQMRKELKVLLDNGEPLHAASVLSQLLRLRQLNLDPHILGVSARSVKTDFIVDTVKDYCVNGGSKLVVFSCFETYVSYLSEVFSSSNIKHVVITGKISLPLRAEAVRRFQEEDDVKVVLGTIQSMGEGITLTAASDVIMADRWWNPSVCKQAEDRLWRIGQKNAVQVILPINESSVDSILDRILIRKERVSNVFLGETGEPVVYEERKLQNEVLEVLKGEG